MSWNSVFIIHFIQFVCFSQVIISLLEKFGRDPKVLDILSNLCVGSGVAVRSSQNNIVDFLLPGKNLLLHTAVVDYVARYN